MNEWMTVFVVAVVDVVVGDLLTTFWLVVYVAFLLRVFSLASKS